MSLRNKLFTVHQTKQRELLNKVFIAEASIDEMEGEPTSLPVLAENGNIAALKARYIESYTAADAPFIYGKIDGLGYIFALKDLEELKND